MSSEQLLQKSEVPFCLVLFGFITGFLTLPTCLLFTACYFPYTSELWGMLSCRKQDLLLTIFFLLSASPTVLPTLDWYYAKGSNIFFLLDHYDSAVCQLYLVVVFPLKLLISFYEFYTSLEWLIWQQIEAGGCGQCTHWCNFGLFPWAAVWRRAAQMCQNCGKCC